MLKNRELVGERMDDLALDASLHTQALAGLQRINAVSLAARAIWNPILEYHLADGKRPLRILDVAAGAGDIVLRLTLKAKKENLPFLFEGCDINPRAVAYAAERARKYAMSIPFFSLDALQEAIPERFDVVVSSLFLHHLAEDSLLRFLRTLHASKAKLLVLSDLQRSLAVLMLAYLGTRLLSRSPIVHVDGPLSVRAAFTSREILRLADLAGLQGAQIRSVWPLRYTFTWRRP